MRLCAFLPLNDINADWHDSHVQQQSTGSSAANSKMAQRHIPDFQSDSIPVRFRSDNRAVCRLARLWTVSWPARPWLRCRSPHSRRGSRSPSWSWARAGVICGGGHLPVEDGESQPAADARQAPGAVAAPILCQRANGRHYACGRKATAALTQRGGS